LWRRVADRVAEDGGASAATDRGGVETLDSVTIGADGVFGDVHRRESMIDGELHSFLGGALQVINGPVFHKTANGAGA